MLTKLRRHHFIFQVSLTVKKEGVGGENPVVPCVFGGSELLMKEPQSRVCVSVRACMRAGQNYSCSLEGNQAQSNNTKGSKEGTV